MSLVFLSHSSANSACALALAQWLEENGWTKYFLDISEDRGLVPGEQWQNALRNASHRCEAVVFVISRPWLESKWCLAEFLLAKQLGKKIFGVLVDTIEIDELPVELTSEWQLCDLVHGEKRRSFDVERDPIVPATQVDLAVAGLAALKRGLDSAGLEATTFAWPPENDPDRSPYRGLQPYTAADAAIFFGRDAAIVRGLDLVRQLRDHNLERMLVILGSSGAGKSSFMRAGLWPRLRRDDHHFYPLPVVRPGRAALHGPEGLIASIATALCDVGIEGVSVGDIRARFRSDASGDTFLYYLDMVRQSLLADAPGNTPEPTFILPVDQCEELYASDVGVEADSLRILLARLGSANTQAVQTTAPRTLVLATIRTDLYTHLQNDERLRDVGRQMIDLPPMDRSEYKHVIEGPARQSSDAGHPLTIEAALTEQLLIDTEGADALPLLAFTLERLFKDYGADGELKLSEYQSLGGITGSLSASIEAAMAQPEDHPAIPADPVERQRLLRQAFIPWLAEVDEQTGERRRRVARFSELPPATHSVLQRLTQARLLLRDLRRSGKDQDEHEVIEVAHEALLRRWPALVGWLDADQYALKSVAAVTRAADSWEQNDRSAEFLTHAGERLRDASTLLIREDFVQRLGTSGTDYLKRCAAAERSRVSKEMRQQRFLRMALCASLLLAVAATALYWQANDARLQAQSSANLARDARQLAESSAALAEEKEAKATILNDRLVQAVYTVSQARASVDRERQQGDRFLSLMHANLSRQRTEKGYAIQGALLALEALPDSLEDPDRPYVVEAEIALYAALDALHTREVLRGHEDAVFKASFSPDGQRIVTASRDGTARLWSSTSGRQIAILDGHDGAVLDASFSANGLWLITGSAGGVARLWNARNGDARAVLHGQNSPIYDVAFSPDGTLVATAASNKSVRIWKVTSGCHAGGFRDSKAGTNGVTFDSTGNQVLTTSDEGVPRVWHRPPGKAPANRHAQPSIATGDGVTRDLACLEHRWTGAAEPYVADPRAASRGIGIQFPGLAAASRTAATEGLSDGNHDTRASATFSPDDQRILTVSTQGTARLWNSAGLSAIDGFHHEHVATATFNPRDSDILLGFRDGSIQVLDAVTGQAHLAFEAETGRLLEAAYSADGSRIVTRGASEGASVWSATTGQALATLGGHWGQILSAGFSPDGSRVVTASSDGDSRIQAVSGLLDSRVLEGHRSAVSSVAFSATGRRLVSASADSTVRIWSLPGGRLLNRFDAHHNGVSDASFSPDGNLVVSASDDGTARIWHALTGEMVAVIDGDGYGFSAAAFDAGGTRVVTSSWDGIARIWSLGDVLDEARTRAQSTQANTKTKPRLLTDAQSVRFTDDGARVSHAAFSPDGKHLATMTLDANRPCATVPDAIGGQDPTHDGGRQIRIWNIDDGQEIQCFAGHDKAVLHAGFSSDGERLASTSVDGTVRLWDVGTGMQLLEFGRDQGYYDSVDFSHDGERLITTSADAGVQLWDAASGKALDRLFPGGPPVSGSADSKGCQTGACMPVMTDARFNANGNRVAVASSDHDIYLWKVLSRQALIRTARIQLPRTELTKSEKRRFFVPNER